MSNKQLLALAYKHIAAMTDREFWQGCKYLRIAEATAAVIRKAAQKSIR